MIFKIFLVATMAFGAYGLNLPSADTLALAKLIPFLNPLDNYLFDGPAEISHAPTRPSTAKKPTLDKMMYYNYYAASMYCQYKLNDLSCDHCKNFKNDVNSYAGNKYGRMIFILHIDQSIQNSFSADEQRHRLYGTSGRFEFA